MCVFRIHKVCGQNPFDQAARTSGPLGLNDGAYPFSYQLWDSPGSLGCRDYAAPVSHIAQDDKLIRTSELSEVAYLSKDIVSIEDNGQSYRYGYIRLKSIFRQPLASMIFRRKKRITLDPNSKRRRATHPMKYYSPWVENQVDCANAVYKTVRLMGRRPPRGDGRSVLKPWRPNRNLIALDEDKSRAVLTMAQKKKILNFIEESLFQGNPVMVGVDYTGDRVANNKDLVTDHWLLITNRFFDAQGTIMFYGIDNAAGGRSKNGEVTFYVSPDLQIWKPPRNKSTNFTIDHSYLVTNARIVKSKR